jgi:hypothetical protein
MLGSLLHILLAFNLFISSFGLIAFEHICSKNGSTFSVFVKPQHCCSKKKPQSCSAAGCTKHRSNQTVSFNKKPCCEDKTHYKKLHISATDITKVVFAEFQPGFCHPTPRISLSDSGFIGENKKTLRFYLYRPPPLPVDNLRVLYQSFLC